MAVGMNASGDRLALTSNIPSHNGPITVAMRVKRVANVSGSRQPLVSWNNNSFGSYAYAAFEGASPLRMSVSWTVDVDLASTPSDNTWVYFFCQIDTATSPRTNMLGYKESGGSWVTNSATGNQFFGDDNFTFGGDSTDAYLNGHIEQLRVWLAKLTTTELDAEMASDTPVRTTDLYLAVGLANNTDLSDTSGNGHNLTAVGTLTSETGPSWGTPPPATYDEAVSLLLKGFVTPTRNIMVSTGVVMATATGIADGGNIGSDRLLSLANVVGYNSGRVADLSAGVTMPSVLATQFAGELGSATYEASLVLANVVSLAQLSQAIANPVLTLDTAITFEDSGNLGVIKAVSFPLGLVLANGARLDAMSTVIAATALAQVVRGEITTSAGISLPLAEGIAILGGQTIFASVLEQLSLGVLADQITFAIEVTTPESRRITVTIESRTAVVPKESRVMTVPTDYEHKKQ